MKVNKESPSHYHLLFATSTRDGGFISLLPDFQFKHSQLHKAKHTPTDPLTKNCWIPLQHKQRSLISTIPGDRHCHLSCRKAASGFILKPNRRNARISPFIVSWICNFALQSFGGYIFLFVRRASSNPTCWLPFFFFCGEREKTDPFLGLCVGLKLYLNLPTGKWGAGMHPQHIHVLSLQSSCGTCAWSKFSHLPCFSGASPNSSLKPALTTGSILNHFTLGLPKFKQHWATQWWRNSPKFKLFQKSPHWTANQECNHNTILLKLLKEKLDNTFSQSFRWALHILLYLKIKHCPASQALQDGQRKSKGSARSALVCFGFFSGVCSCF